MIDYIVIAGLIGLTVGTFGVMIYELVETARHRREMAEKDALRDQQWKALEERRAQNNLSLQQQMDEAMAQARKEQEDVRFQSDLDQFPGGYGDVFGKSFSGWGEALQSLVARGVSLEQPSNEFSRIKKAVQAGLAHDRMVLAQASDPSYTDEQRTSFGTAALHVAEAQDCLLHLNGIEAGWAQARFDAMDQATGPANGASKRAGRL